MMTKLLLLAGLFSGSLMDPIISYHKLATGIQLRGLQVPVAQAAMAFVETNEGRLLEITGVTRLTNPTGNAALSLARNANYPLNGLPGTLVRVLAAGTGPEGLTNTNPPTTKAFNVRGIPSQYAPGSTGGYQLLPRLASDLILGGGQPRLTEGPVPMNMSATGFTVVYSSTLNPGDTRVCYGLSAQELKKGRADAALTTHHSLTLENLIPGTTYYVEVSSRNAVGIEKALREPFITGNGKRNRPCIRNQRRRH